MDHDKKKKIITISASCFGILLIAAAAVFTYIKTRPVKLPDPKAKPEEARNLLASKDFQKLTPQQQDDYVRKMRPTRRPTAEERKKMREDWQKMTDEQKKTMRENMGRVHMRRMEKDLDNFFKMSKAEQIAELDRRIEAQNKMRERMRARRQNRQRNQPAANQQQNQQNQQRNNANQQNSQNNNRRRRPSAQDRREWESNMPPATRAKFQQYHQMMRLRRQGKLK